MRLVFLLSFCSYFHAYIIRYVNWLFSCTAQQQRFDFCVFLPIAVSFFFVRISLRPVRITCSLTHRIRNWTAAVWFSLHNTSNEPKKESGDISFNWNKILVGFFFWTHRHWFSLVGWLASKWESSKWNTKVARHDSPYKQDGINASILPSWNIQHTSSINAHALTIQPSILLFIPTTLRFSVTDAQAKAMCAPAR